MVIIKSYTDLSQSKTLSKILPLESADMHYSKDFDSSWFVDLAEYTSVKIPKYVGNIEEHLLPCWSLAALLDVLPEKYTKLLIKEGGVYRILIKDLCMTSLFNNPVDACVAMIEELHKLNLL